MRWPFALLSALFLCTGALAEQEAVLGAKELFYDPASGGVTSVSPPAPPDIPHGKDGRRRVRVPTTAPNRPASAPGPSALGLSYRIELADAAGRPGGEVTAERLFRSGERIRLHFRSNAGGQIVLVQLGSSGTATVLFPDAAKKLVDGSLQADEERVLPTPASWFRFDDHPGTDRLLAFFARRPEELDRFPLRPRMNEREAGQLLAAVEAQGSKDLIIETETREAAEMGTYGVNRAGNPVVLLISLRHR